MTGSIVLWRETWGFIRPDDGSRDVFVRADRLQRVDHVSYTTVPNPRRRGQLMAIDIERIEDGRPPRGLRVPARPTTTNWSNFSGGGRRAA